MATLRQKDINFLILEENLTKKKKVIVKNSNLYLIKTKKTT